ncbi:MAG: 50S ribosomal protein L10 [Oscillospiraceae bacterium]
MPSEKILERKKAYVAELKQKIADAPAGVLVDYKGISVADDTALRRELREAGVEYTVVKNTMLHLALEGGELSGLEEVLTGTTALALSGEDALAPARILCKYAEKSKGAFSVKSGYMEGKVVPASEIEALSKLPGRDGLLSMLLSAITGNVRGLAVALNAIAEQKEGGDAA